MHEGAHVRGRARGHRARGYVPDPLLPWLAPRRKFRERSAFGAPRARKARFRVWTSPVDRERRRTSRARDARDRRDRARRTRPRSASPRPSSRDRSTTTRALTTRFPLLLFPSLAFPPFRRARRHAPGERRGALGYDRPGQLQVLQAPAGVRRGGAGADVHAHGVQRQSRRVRVARAAADDVAVRVQVRGD